MPWRRTERTRDRRALDRRDRAREAYACHCATLTDTLMSTSEVADAVRQFFSRVSLAHLALPLGSYGRPRDNLYRLTFLVDRPRRLILELDDQILVSIAGDPHATLRAESNGREVLVIDGYSQVLFAALLYASDRPTEPLVFSSGELRFESQPSHDIAER